MSSNRLKKSLVLIIGIVLGILIYSNCVSIPCLFHTIFKIPCPGCGMTRAFMSIFTFDLFGAIYYNLLSIPLFLFLIIITISLVYDIVKDKKIVEEKILKFLEKYCIIIIVLLVITMILNIYHKI